MKKRVLAGIMAGCLIIGTLTACGQGSTDTEKSDDSASAATTEEAGDASEDEASAEDLRVTMILSDRDEWLSEMESGALAAAEEIGIDLVTQDAQKDTSKMLQFIETAKNDGQKAVIVNMVDPETGQECIDAAGDMKVVFVNRYPTDLSLLNENAVYVGSDENQAGDLQAEYLSEYFEEKRADGYQIHSAERKLWSDCDNTQNRLCIKRIKRQRNQRDRGNCSSRCRL